MLVVRFLTEVAAPKSAFFSGSARRAGSLYSLKLVWISATSWTKSGLGGKYGYPPAAQESASEWLARTTVAAVPTRKINPRLRIPPQRVLRWENKVFLSVEIGSFQLFFEGVDVNMAGVAVAVAVGGGLGLGGDGDGRHGEESDVD